MQKLLFPVSICLIATLVSAQSHHRHRNAALLGVVTGPTVQGKKKAAEKTGAVVLHVLAKSPAAKAGLERGDAITKIGSVEITGPRAVDAALRDASPGDEVTIGFRRAKKAKTVDAKLVDRAKYRGDFLRRRKRGETKFKAPEWFAYAWGNLEKGATGPTRENTKDKVVVLHAFQSW